MMHGLFDLVDLWKQAGDRLAAEPARLLRDVPETPPGIDNEGSGANCKSPSGAATRPPQGQRRPRAGRCVRGAATLGALLFAVSCGAAQVTPRPVTPRGELPADERATVQLFERAKATVVFISTRERRLDPWTRNVFSAPKGTGSGFIWDAQGHVVTNYHVIAGASEARIRLADGRDYAASLAGASPGHDLAVLRIKVPVNPPPPVPIGSSADLKVGQKVYAIGNPFGLDWTLTSGVVSALDRSLPSDAGPNIEHLIQTDAAINPGNSGGPLLDSAGRLIGINTAIYSPSGAYAGVGFAVPVDTVNRVVPTLIAHGKYLRPSLGIQMDESLNRQLIRRFRVQGVFVLRVLPDSGAAAAGLRAAVVNEDGEVVPGDVILGVEGKPVTSVAELLARLDDYQAGDTPRLNLLRAGRQVDAAVRLR